MVQDVVAQVLGTIELLSEVLRHAAGQHVNPKCSFHPVLVCKLWWDVGSDHLWATVSDSARLLKMLAPVEYVRSQRSLGLNAPNGIYGTTTDRLTFYASRVTELHLHTKFSAELAAELAGCLAPDCFPRLRNLTSMIPAYQMLPFVKGSPRLSKITLLQRGEDPSLSRLPTALKSFPHISVQSFSMTVGSNLPSAVPPCIDLLRYQPFITHLSLNYETSQQLFIICQKMDQLQYLTSCELICESATGVATLQEVASILPKRPSCPKLRVLHLEVCTSAEYHCHSFDRLLFPLLSFHELRHLRVDMVDILPPISREQVSSMATAWPKMQRLELITGVRSHRDGSAMSLATLPYFQEFGESLEVLTVSVAFNDLSLPEANVPPMTGLRILDICDDELDPDLATSVAEIIDTACTEWTHITISSADIGCTGEDGWDAVNRTLQALRRARKRALARPSGC